MSNETEDYLTEDPEIGSQKIVLLSFLSPEKILANKDVFFFQQFLKEYDIQWRTTKLEAWMGEQLQAINSKLETLAGSLDGKDLSGAAQEVRSNLVKVDRYVEEFKEYCRKNTKEISQSNLQQEYDDFMFKNGGKLEEAFFAKNDFHTTIRGIKVRGVFSSEAEASARARRLQKTDPNFNIYMGAVGKWMAWDPDPSRVPNQEYANEQLNTLMKQYRDNEEQRDQFYTEQKKQKIGKAVVKKESIEDSASNAAAAGGGGSEQISSTFGGGSGSGSYDGMFSGPADLAIQRKMEKK